MTVGRTSAEEFVLGLINASGLRVDGARSIE
jgi:hypothetical protein